MYLYGNEKVEMQTDSKFERYGDTVYCPFDPALTIGGEKLKFIVNVAADPSSLQYDNFKELGRFISINLKEDKIKTEIRRRLYADMDTVEASGVNGLCKLYIYEHYVVPRLSWVFLVHDLNLWFARELDKRVTSRLKIWAGLYRSSDLGALFRRREHLGLQITSLELHYKRMQVVKCCLLENSQDQDIRAIYELRKSRVVEYNNRWSGPKEVQMLEPIVEHNFRFAGQTGTAGLGACKSNPYVANPSKAQWREKMTETLVAHEEEERIRHASCLPLQGVWTHWENTLPLDRPWSSSDFFHAQCSD